MNRGPVGKMCVECTIVQLLFMKSGWMNYDTSIKLKPASLKYETTYYYIIIHNTKYSDTIN